jgi:S1-C subfamily serine protease
MKLAALLALVLTGCGCVSAPRFGSVEHTAHLIEMPLGSCSATAISAHWLVTAAHCLYEGGPVTAVDGKPAKTLDVMLDGHDHALVRVDGTFRSWAPVGRVMVGDRVRLMGNPGDWRSVYRVGLLSAVNRLTGCPPVPGIVAKQCTLMLFQLITGNGDSGSGYFNDAGEIVAVHTGTVPLGLAGMAFAIPFAFTAQQWEAAQG